MKTPSPKTMMKGFERFTAAGDRIQVIGDDYLVTSAERVREAARRGSVNAVLIKVNQAGTVSEAKAACEEGARCRLGTIVSARSEETEDTSIVHLAIGWRAGQLKVGSFSRSERMAKWNEGLRIEEALGSEALFAGLRTKCRSRRQVWSPSDALSAEEANEADGLSLIEGGALAVPLRSADGVRVYKGIPYADAAGWPIALAAPATGSAVEDVRPTDTFGRIRCRASSSTISTHSRSAFRRIASI